MFHFTKKVIRQFGSTEYASKLRISNWLYQQNRKNFPVCNFFLVFNTFTAIAHSYNDLYSSLAETDRAICYSKAKAISSELCNKFQIYRNLSNPSDVPVSHTFGTANTYRTGHIEIIFNVVFV